MIAVLASGVLALAAFYAVWNYGFYIDMDPDAPVEAGFTTDGTKILKIGNDGTEEFQIKGVEISASMPEHAASDFAPEKEDYLRWFSQIQEMGANTIKAAGIMDDTFYDAFFEFNTEREEPLYLLQGILIQDAANYGAGDAYESDYMGQLQEDG